MSIRPIFAWYDLWVGAFWDAGKRRLYVFPIPCFGVVFQFKAPTRSTPPQEERSDPLDLAAADDNRPDVPRDAQGRDAYQIIADCNRQAMLVRAGAKDRSREPLQGPRTDMLVSRILLDGLPDIDPKGADKLAVKINDALCAADDNHKALVEVVEAARDLVMKPGGLVNRGVGVGLVVVEKADKSDPHYRLCTAFEKLDALAVAQPHQQAASAAAINKKAPAHD